MQQAVVHCLRGMDQHAHRAYPWPGPALLAVLREAPVPGHPDPSARYVSVVPAPTPAPDGAHPDDAVAVLRHASTGLHDPVVQANLVTATGPVRILAWVFMHAAVTDAVGPPQMVRYIDAVDADGTTYVLTRFHDQPEGVVAVDPAPEPGTSDVLDLLRSLARMLRPGT
ncbi:hypothetical protein [Micromonospora sp. NPDC092111]|uniref:hypothetical protein n=1 Tax=Micromonospora sp. NPDC092111 TaxID=3364289 RepID=UPI003811BBDA